MKMATVLKRSVISTVKIGGELQNVSLLPLVFVVEEDGWKHSCPTHEHTVLPSYSAQVEPKPRKRKSKRQRDPFRIDENIKTMVQITTERESLDNDSNFTDEEKLMYQIYQSGSVETNLLQNHHICENLAVVDDTYNFLTMDKVPFIEVDGQQMSSWIDVKELLFPKCSEPNCCEVLNCLMKKFLNQPNLMHPCSEKEQKLFLRKFKLVFQECMLISLPEVKKRLEILQAEVEINHLEKSGQRACSYLQTTCSRRPKTSLPRQRNPRDNRPKSADKINSNGINPFSLYDRLAVVPILLVPEKIREPNQYGRSGQGPEADTDDIHFPVLLHYGQEKIAVPCSIIARVFPQSYNVLLHCLLTTTNNQRQHEQYIFSACSSHQALSFNRWISQYLKESSVHGITTGSLLINLEKFSELTYDVLPLSTRRILQSKCRWPDLTEESFKNIIIWDNRPRPFLKKSGDSTRLDNAEDNSLVSDSNYNAGKVTNVLRDQPIQSQSETGKYNALNGMECIENKVYDLDDNKPYLPIRTRRKGVLRVRPVSKFQTTAVHNPDETSALSVSASHISSSKTLRVKSGRKISKSGHAKSPYLSQPAVVKHGAFFSRRLQTTKSKVVSVRPRSQATDHASELWSKAFIATPPNILRVKSPTKDIRINPEESSQSPPGEIVLECAQVKNSVDTSCILPYNTTLTLNEKERNKSEVGRRYGKRIDPVTLNDDCGFQGDIDSPFTTAVLLASGINLQTTTNPQIRQKDICLITGNKSENIPSSNVEQSKSNMTNENRESRDPTLEEKDHESSDNKSTVFQPVPSWQQLNLQLDSKHPYEDLHKMYQLPPQSSIPTSGKSSTNVPDDDIIMSSSSMYSTSGSRPNSVTCNILEKEEVYSLRVDTSSTMLSPTNSRLSVYSSDETNVPEAKTPSQNEETSAAPHLNVDGLIEALDTIRATAPKSKIKNILADYAEHNEDEKTYIELASEVMKSNVIENEPVSPARPISTTFQMLLGEQIPQRDFQDETPIINSSSSNEICVCKTSISNCDLPVERNSNKQYIQIVNNPCQFKVADLPKLTYTRKAASKSPYKGSALKLNNDSTTTKTLQNALRKSKLLNNTQSLLTPDLLNVTRFQSLGNILVTNSTSDNKAPEKLAKVDKKEECETTLKSDTKVNQEKRVEHIQINSPIPLRPPSDDKQHNETEIERLASCTNQIPTTLQDFIANGKDESIPSLDLRNLTEAVSRKSVRVQYEVKAGKTVGTGHFLHNKLSTKMKKGLHVRHTMPITKSQYNSSHKKSPPVFQEIVSNKSSFSKPSLQNNLSTIPSENDYHIPPSSPNVTCRSQDSTFSNSDFLAKNNGKYRMHYESCPGCQNEKMVSEQQHRGSSAPYKPGRVIRQRYEDGRISVISVHDSINNQLREHGGFHARNNCSLKPKPNQSSKPNKNMNQLEDTLSVISLCSPRELKLYNSKRSTTPSTQSGDRKTVHNTTELSLSKDDLPVARELVDPNTSSNVVNVIFQYGPKHTRTTIDGGGVTQSRLDNAPKHTRTTIDGGVTQSRHDNAAKHTRTTIDGGRVTQSRHDNAVTLARSSNKRQSHFKQSARNTQKLRICIDLVGLSEDSPLEIKKLV